MGVAYFFYKSLLHMALIGLFLSSNSVVNCEMEANTNSEMFQMMKGLTERFDTLQADVDQLKKGEHERSSGADSRRSWSRSSRNTNRRSRSRSTRWSRSRSARGCRQHTIPTGSSSPAGTNLEDATMVSSAAGDASGLSMADPTACSGDRQPVSNNSSASHMAYLREKYRGQEFSDEASSLLLSSWRAKTNKSYDSLFGKWHSWCLTRGTDPFSGPVTGVVNFLAH